MYNDMEVAVNAQRRIAPLGESIYSLEQQQIEINRLISDIKYRVTEEPLLEKPSNCETVVGYNTRLTNMFDMNVDLIEKLNGILDLL